MSKTACIVPWTNLVIGPDGRASFCCEAPVTLTIDGRQGSIYNDSISDLWNAREIVEVRAAIASGDKPEACRVCWDREAAGLTSRRLTTNRIYPQIGGELSLDAIHREGANTDYRLDRMPDWFTLELGNACDLKCRSCNPLSSSRIATDKVHAAWAGEYPINGSEGKAGQHGALRLVPQGKTAWFDDIDSMADMVASGATASNAMLSLIGGEPFLINRTWRLLSALVERGVAGNLFIGLATNGQHRVEKLQELAPHFRGISLALSIDGLGKLYEYLRHGSNWEKLLEHLPWFRQLPNVQLIAGPTFQNANALDMVPLLRFLDEQGLPVVYNAVNWPARLRPDNLPPNVRRIAAKRLRHYLESECKACHFSVVRNYCQALEAPGDDFDEELFAEFMSFTADLDADRGESIHRVAPELVALVRAGGVTWPDPKKKAAIVHSMEVARETVFTRPEVEQRLNRMVSPHDVIFPGFEAQQEGLYFKSALSHLDFIEKCLADCDQAGLADARAVADFASHYGRITRALKAGLPQAAVYAVDIDAEAVKFCADKLGAVPVVTGWRPGEASPCELPKELDAIICVSLLTHTSLDHWRRVLRAWARMLRPKGIVAFTFLSDLYALDWLAGMMGHYGIYTEAERTAAIQSLKVEGFGFASLTSTYGGEPSYGVAFARPDVVKREVAAAGFELLSIPTNAALTFGQDLAVLRKPGIETDRLALVDSRQRAVSIVALYDPRCYAPKKAREGDPAASTWARLTIQDPPVALPTELGFTDPRVPEVREAQARLAQEHGIDAFCYIYYWNEGPRWDAPLRDLLISGRPDFPFCLMITIQNTRPISPKEEVRLFNDIAPALRDHRYLKIDGRPLVIVRDVSPLIDPRSTARQWCAKAVVGGIGEIHLCAVEPVDAERPEEIGFDSFLQGVPDNVDFEGLVNLGFLKAWPEYCLFRSVRCQRRLDPITANQTDGISAGLYEHWLRSAINATRERNERLVFIDSWNDWLRGSYLEPDDRDGRGALSATKRATIGPGSGTMLLRQLRDALGEVSGQVAALLAELGQVVSLDENRRDRLLATIEAALCRNQERLRPGPQRLVPVASRQLPPSGSGFCLDRVGLISGTELYGLKEPVPVASGEVNLAGWCHAGDCLPEDVELFIALESVGTPASAGAYHGDMISPVPGRVSRPDVAAARPGYPGDCGFDVTIDLSGLRPGVYQIALVQRTPNAAFRDATPSKISIQGATCSKS